MCVTFGKIRGSNSLVFPCLPFQGKVKMNTYTENRRVSFLTSFGIQRAEVYMSTSPCQNVIRTLSWFVDGFAERTTNG